MTKHRSQDEIADAIAMAIRTDDRLDDVLGAVIDVWVFALGSMCPACRQRQMTWLKKNADKLQAEADRQAREIPPGPCNNFHGLH
jgi:hypothetical protein